MLPGALRPAARLSVVSFLLLGREVTRWPFYRQKIANRLKVITEGNATRPATPDDENLTEEAPSLEGEGSAAPYFEYRRLLDELRIRLATKGVNLRDRLDAQSLAWWLAEGPPPTQWDADEHQRFLDFQRNVLTEDSVLDDLPPTKAWLVRAARRTGEDAIGNRDVVKEFLEGGFVAIGWADVDAVSPGMDGMSIFHEVQQTYSERPLGWWRTSTGNLNSFVNRMEVGHLVVTVDKDKIFVGQVTAPYSFDINRPLGTTRRWGVAWFNPGTPASRKVIKVEHPGLYARLRSWLTVTELTEEIAAVESLIGLTPSAPDPHQPVELPTATEDLADGLHIPQDWLQTEVIDLLTEKKQVVFYGPPGTGKTLIAQRIAEHLTDDPEAFELVQFHPSYSYEDFFEGYRPIQTDTGFGIAYTLTHGPLRRLAERATANPSQPHVLIIDEINRGNVPKIFGELLFLLEYRDEQIPLMYSSESEGRFGLPKNLFIIATMNTADRSIALIDAALRRRFYFVPFMPREEPVSSVLTKWLDRHGHAQEAADLLRLLNDRIDSDDIAIGPSYFITTGGPPNLERIWRHSIMPLLEEHYFGTGRAVAMDFGLAALRTHLTATERDESGTVEEPEPSPG